MVRGLAAVALFVAVAPHALAAPQPMVKDGRYVMRDGGAIYANVCQACHMPNAKGAAGAGVYPALASNPRLAAAAYPIHVVIHGQKGMPAFGALLDDDQITAVVTYVRGHFGNSYPGPVTAADVKAER
jgi:mono/diheme cytochrome c family protein